MKIKNIYAGKKMIFAEIIILTLMKLIIKKNSKNVLEVV